MISYHCKFDDIAHIISIPATTSSTKTEKILALFKFGPDEEMILTFTDKDGDSVVVADDEDLLTEMVKQQHSPNHPLRINVKLNNGNARNFLSPSPAGRFGDTYQPHLHSMDNRGSQGPQVQPKLHNSAMLDYIGQFTIIVEQIDNGKKLTRNRKFLTVVPLVL